MADLTLTVVVADDEPIARRGLERLLRREPDVRIMATCENGMDALAAIRERSPRVALLDIAMPGMTGIDVVRALAPAERPAIIFVTAFDQFAIDAFDLHAVDYLLKPFDDDRFRVAFDRVRHRLRGDSVAGIGAPRLESLLDAMARRTAPLSRIAVKDGDTTILIPMNDIWWCEAEDNYVRIHAAGRRYLVRTTLQSLLDKLDPDVFARIHRSYVVNLTRVRELRPAGNGDYVTVLEDGKALTMSRSYRDDVLQRVSAG